MSVTSRDCRLQVKPENLLWDAKAKCAKLADFGTSGSHIACCMHARYAIHNTELHVMVCYARFVKSRNALGGDYTHATGGTPVAHAHMREVPTGTPNVGTCRNVVTGTPAFFAPEMCKVGGKARHLIRTVTRRTDATHCHVTRTVRCVASLYGARM